MISGGERSLAGIHLFEVNEEIAEKRDLSSTQPDAVKGLRQKLGAVYRDLIAESPIWTIARVSPNVKSADRTD